MKKKFALSIRVSFLTGVFFSLYLLRWGWRSGEDYENGRNCVNIVTKAISRGKGGDTYYKKLFCIKVPFWVN